MAALEAEIADTRGQLDAALRDGDEVAVLDKAGMLVGMLTAARAEREALEVGSAHLQAARALPQVEASAWLLHGLATAAQYVGERARANALFREALELCQAHGWRRLEHFVLHHWGRSKVEEGELAVAEQYFRESLLIRRELGDPRAQSSERALEEVARLRTSRKGPP
jgi:tetratricopeptide (TPR) repeat protein